MAQLGQSEKPEASGLMSFAIAMAASILSITGTEMTSFAIINWAWEKTGSTMATSLVTVSVFTTVILVSLFSGALIDRWSRKKIIIGTDIIGAVASVIMLMLLFTDSLQLWHTALFGVILGVLGAFQTPAYLASVTQMVAEKQRPRANSLYQMSSNIAVAVSAILGGILFSIVGLEGVLIIDIVTFSIIIITIFFLKIPQPVRDASKKTTILYDIREGYTHLFTKKSVLLTALIFTSINVAFGTYQGIFRPMVLTFTNNNEQILGWAVAAVGLGSIVGGILMSSIKLPKQRIPYILLSWAIMSSFGFVLSGWGRSLPIWLFGRFTAGILSNIAISMVFSIWQEQIAPEFQGRVFSIIRLMVQISIPIAASSAAFLGDNVFEPGMQQGQSLASTFSWLVGTGPGTGLSLLMMTAGLIFGIAIPLCGFLIPSVRNAERQSTPSDPEPAVVIIEEQEELVAGA